MCKTRSRTAELHTAARLYPFLPPLEGSQLTFISRPVPFEPLRRRLHQYLGHRDWCTAADEAIQLERRRQQQQAGESRSPAGQPELEAALQRFILLQWLWFDRLCAEYAEQARVCPSSWCCLLGCLFGGPQTSQPLHDLVPPDRHLRSCPATRVPHV